MKSPSFSVGIEEEYLIVDLATRALIREVPKGFLPDCQRVLKQQVSPEFLQCQIEIGTQVCGSISEVRENLAFLRRTVSAIAEDHGVAIIAASTHPFAGDVLPEHTNKERYNSLAEDLQQVVRRLVICGMHVHVGIDDDDLRIDLLGQVSYALPHFLALSTSSPFWKGHDSGLMSYRIAVWDEVPRTGLPEIFDSYTDYARHVDVLVDAGVIEDGTKLWWDIRPSERFPTLEMRICDVMTSIDDAICVTALYRCWLRMLYRLRVNNQRWRRYANLLVNENRWRAHRYGFNEGLVDFGRGQIVPYEQLLNEMIDLIYEDAQHFDCVAEIEHGRRILARGSSSHRQLAVFRQAKENNADDREAFIAVVDWLIEETRANLGES